MTDTRYSKIDLRKLTNNIDTLGKQRHHGDSITDPLACKARMLPQDYTTCLIVNIPTLIVTIANTITEHVTDYGFEFIRTVYYSVRLHRNSVKYLTGKKKTKMVRCLFVFIRLPDTGSRFSIPNFKNGSDTVNRVRYSQSGPI